MNQNALDKFNKILNDLGLWPTRRQNTFIHWRIPRSWKGTRYVFGYTPHRTVKDGKTGFWACKYRVLKDGSMKLVKAVRFGKRKIARERSLQWHSKYYK